jgi:hypothetical protein
MNENVSMFETSLISALTTGPKGLGWNVVFGGGDCSGQGFGRPVSRRPVLLPLCISACEAIARGHCINSTETLEILSNYETWIDLKD